ncbi:MAG: tetratricopeptide repeat protein [Desulfobacterales bacterium]|jgi:tetratricopeptide (TPR) repeat protein
MMRQFSKLNIKQTVWWPAGVVLLFFIVGFSIYSNTLESPFQLDDFHRIKKNPDIQLTELSVKNVLKAAFGQKSATARPVGNISFALNYYFHKYDVWGYHVVNIIVHILTGIILYAFIKATLALPSVQLKDNQIYGIAFFAALLWLVHPLQTQSVTYIVQRLNSLAAMFYVLSLWFYLKGRLAKEGQRNWLWFACAGLAWVLALGCKQIAATLPFFVFLYEWYFFQDCSAKWLKRNLKYVFLLLFLFGLVALLYIGLKPVEKMASIGDYGRKEFTFLQRVLTQPRVVIYYLSLIFLPQPSRLNVDYDFPLSYSLANPITTLLSLGAIIGLLTLAFFLAKRERLISFCILWFFGNLVIESSIIPLAIIFEHRNYLPSMMVCLIIALLVYRYLKIEWLRIGLLCLVVLVLAVWTYQRNRVWQSPLTLWTDVVEKSPNKVRAQTNLGFALVKNGEIDEGIEHYHKALQINPNFLEAHNNLGAALSKQGKVDEAIQQYRKALQINPHFMEAYNNLGIALDKQGKYDEAILNYKKVLEIEPDNVRAYNNLAASLVKLGKTDEAVEHYKKALQIEPDFAKAHNNLGAVLKKQGKNSEAIEHFRKALQINPDFEKAHNNLGIVLAKQGKIDEAIQHYHKALQLNPESSETMFNLGDVLARQGKTEQAIRNLNKAVQIKPDYAEAHSNLGGMYIQQGNIEKAINHSQEALRLDPQLVEAYNSLGIGLMHQGKIDAAISQFQKAVQIKPDFTKAANNLDRALAIRNELEAEVSRLQKILKDNPENVELQFQLGNLYFRIGELHPAKQQYEKALQLNPKFVPALNNLALVTAANKEYDSALAAFLEALNYDPDNAETHYNIACMYARLNKPDQSIEWLKKAIDKGYTNWESIQTDADLENLRGLDAYQELIKGH